MRDRKFGLADDSAGPVIFRMFKANTMNRLGIAIFSALTATFLPSLSSAQQQGGYYGPHMMWDGGSYGMILGPFMMIAVLALIVVVVVLLVRWLSGTGHIQSGTSSAARTPLDILKERYARGEIEKEEFEERRRTLEG